MPSRPEIASLLDLSLMADFPPQYGPEEIRRTNPQRDAMEQLSGVLAMDVPSGWAVGYKDLSAQDFWCPNEPRTLSPGCVETAAQLAVFFLKRSDLFPNVSMFGIGGLGNLRFFNSISSPCRLVVAVRTIDIDPPCAARMEFFAEVNAQPVYSGDLLCVPLDCAAAQRKGLRAGTSRPEPKELIGSGL